MIEVVISLIYTAYSLLESEIKKRQSQASDVTSLLKVLHVLDAAGKFLRDGDNAGLDAVVFALNKAVDATTDTEILVIDPKVILSDEKIEKIESVVQKVKGKKVK